ncbi:hypothetical protein SUGI_0339340 [Cryptomeria japonica]|nr:hypothetical protein SUGI_0339340 [Cryptomeria japonica]
MLASKNCDDVWVPKGTAPPVQTPEDIVNTINHSTKTYRKLLGNWRASGVGLQTHNWFQSQLLRMPDD